VRTDVSPCGAAVTLTPQITDSMRNITAWLLSGFIILVVALVPLRLLLHSVSIRNQSGMTAVVACGAFVNVVVKPKESRELMFSLLGTSMRCEVRVGEHVSRCSTELAVLSVASVEIGPDGTTVCESFDW